MICFSAMQDCDDPSLPDRHQCLLRLKLLQLLRGYGESDEQPGYGSEVEGYMIYIEKGDVHKPLGVLGIDAVLADLEFVSVVFCEYSQCFVAIFMSDPEFSHHFIIPVEHVCSSMRASLEGQLALESSGMYA